MATNLAGGVCIGQFNACILRVALLDNTCHPLGGADSGIVSAAIVNIDAEPDVEDGTKFEPKNGCGRTIWTYSEIDRIKRWKLTGSLVTWDYEMCKLMFGGDLILGAAGGLFAGQVIGWAPPNYNAASRSGVYLEVISQNAVEGQGDCNPPSGATDYPTHTGHVFGKVRPVLGTRSFANEAAMLQFTAIAEANPILANGPWNDYPGAGYEPNTPYFSFGYSYAQFQTIAATVACGYAALPAGS